MSVPLLDREEYIEQAYFFRVYRERLEDGVPSQEILATVHEEVLATAKLTMAIEFLRGEILLHGRISPGMKRLVHYFTPFQTFVMERAEDDRSRFDQKIALAILERQAEYLADAPRPAGLFIYQFECIARNRLGYDAGMTAMADDPLYDADWREWVLKARLQLGSTDFADMIYFRSQHHLEERRRRTGTGDLSPAAPILFGIQEGRIARANRGKDPLFMFGALQRQLGYPSVPRAQPRTSGPAIHPALEARLQKLEKRLQLMESETKDQLNLSEFYVKPPDHDSQESHR
ncbi:MAG: hypothetical protein WD066_08355 [Planctomycetaceae bacterium]